MHRSQYVKGEMPDGNIFGIRICWSSSVLSLIKTYKVFIFLSKKLTDRLV
jgi:hypothetical protein